jgi:toxin YoeB
MFKYETTKRFDWEYERFLKRNKKTALKVRYLVADVLNHPREGLGRPERLRHFGGEVWSRHVDGKNRLVYEILGDVIRFDRCGGHYDDR